MSTRNGPGDDSERTDVTLDRRASALLWPLGSLSDDDGTLAGQLEQAHPVSNGPAERLVAITDAFREQPLAPAAAESLLTESAGKLSDRVNCRDQLQPAVVDELEMPGPCRRARLPCAVLLAFPGTRFRGNALSTTRTSAAAACPRPYRENNLCATALWQTHRLSRGQIAMSRPGCGAGQVP